VRVALTQSRRSRSNEQSEGNESIQMCSQSEKPADLDAIDNNDTQQEEEHPTTTTDHELPTPTTSAKRTRDSSPIRSEPQPKKRRNATAITDGVAAFRGMEERTLTIQNKDQEIRMVEAEAKKLDAQARMKEADAKMKEADAKTEETRLFREMLLKVFTHSNQ